MLAAVFMDYKIRQEQKSSESTISSTKPFVLAARNVHKSMIDALALLDLSVKLIMISGAPILHLVSKVP